MTKSVKIENADKAPYEVIVEEWNKNSDGSMTLLNVTKLAKFKADVTTTIHKTKYLVIREA